MSYIKQQQQQQKKSGLGRPETSGTEAGRKFRCWEGPGVAGCLEGIAFPVLGSPAALQVWQEGGRAARCSRHGAGGNSQRHALQGDDSATPSSSAWVPRSLTSL